MSMIENLQGRIDRCGCQGPGMEEPCDLCVIDGKCIAEIENLKLALAAVRKEALEEAAGIVEGVPDNLEKHWILSNLDLMLLKAVGAKIRERAAALTVPDVPATHGAVAEALKDV